MKMFSFVNLILMILLVRNVTVFSSPIAYPSSVLLESDRIARLESMRADLVKRTTDFSATLKQVGQQPTLRDLTHGAQALLATGGSAKDAEGMITRAFSQQQMDTAAVDFGTFPWQEGHTEIQDANAIDFTMRPLAAIFALYSDQLSPTFKSGALPHLKAGIEALKRHQVTPSYTNIYVMNLVSLIVLGETLGDSSAISKGASNLNTWAKLLATSGLGEYDSPTYSAVQLATLHYGYNLIKDQGMHEIFKRALDLTWLDVAANFFPGTGTLSGSHSRDYDFLFGKGLLDRYYYLEGMIPVMGGGGELSDLVSVAMGELEGNYRPPEAPIRLARGGERLIRSRYGSLTGQERYNFVTPDFAIGSSGSGYGPQDKQVSVQFASVKSMFPNVAVWFDRFDSPYGKFKSPDKSGHLKPTHMQNLIASVQERGSLLLLLDGALGLSESGISSLATDVIIPMNPDTAMMDGVAVSLANGGNVLDIPVPVNAVFGFREGSAALGIRVFYAEGCRGQLPVIRLKNDGKEWGAARLAIYQYRGDSVLLVDKHVRTGILMVAGKVDSLGLKAFLDKFSKASTPIEQSLTANGEWQVSAQLPGLKLEASLEKLPLYRRVNGKNFTVSTPLTVSGVGWEELGLLAVQPHPTQKMGQFPYVPFQMPFGEGSWNLLGRRNSFRAVLPLRNSGFK